MLNTPESLNHPDYELDTLIAQTPALWRGRSARAAHVNDRSSNTAWPTGFDALDAALPGGGWPRSGIVDVAHQGLPAPLQLFLPLAAQLTRAARRVTLIAPPLLPFAPALAQAGVQLEQLVWITPSHKNDLWWTLETALRSDACGLVLAWPAAAGGRIDMPAVRRWQVAAQAGNTLGVLFMPPGQQAPNVHIRLSATHHQVNILKARGLHGQVQVAL